ncbi:hypothetical protein UA32_11860 [Photobacterium angustum]|uniref:ParB/RepB/Spo0J family partition protein n=1 Tax=Photobacterium angustum TaxID=661 RepID=A0ABX5H192_PHOAN|nr:ParB/RepB/Spo0J family partition protein [Photobacterium angustum]KJG37655.1 hypothetical protein UA32_11860 [Photobacterium angustum]PSX07112.1 ParB/RepB/Spo0J family partition protein [Photobacterium angustum]
MSIEATTINSDVNAGELLFVPPSKIRPLPIGEYSGNYRKSRPSKKKDDVRESIRKNGILQSLVVRVSEECPDEFELIAGYGRLEHAVELGMVEVPILNKGIVSDQDALAMALTENVDRSELTIADEVEHAKRFLSIFNGDHKTAALRLNKSEAVYRDLLQIGRCDDQLITALSDDTHPLLKGHCSVLSQFPKEIQLKILKAIEAEPSKYTVSYVKSQSKNFELKLINAKFDQKAAGCGDCQFNSQQQFNVFSDEEEESKCSNPRCYLDNQQKWLNDVRIPDLKVEYGTVLTTEQKNVSDVKTVDEKSLGKDQVSRCADCQNCVVLVAVEPEHFGRAINNICIDLSCYSKNQKAHEDSLKPEKLDDDNQITANSDQQSEVGISQPEKPKSQNLNKAPAKASSPKLSKKLHRTYANMIQSVAVANVAKQPTFTQALIVKALSSSLRHCNRISEPVENLIKMTPEELSKLMQELLIKFAQQELDLESEAAEVSGFDANRVYRKSLEFFVPDQNERQALMIESWSPTKDILSMLTKAQISIIATESGFEYAYDSKNGEGAWAKLSKGAIGTTITTFLAFEFDWSNYAPQSYLELGVNYRKPV